MTRFADFISALFLTSFVVLFVHSAAAEDKPDTTPNVPKAFIDGIGPGWVNLLEEDFADVNGNPETWEWDGRLVKSTGKPVGVYQTKKQFKNFELVLQWRHLEFGGNSGVFAWVPSSVLKDLPKGKLPRGGIEVQMLDHGYAVNYKKRTGKEGDWFSTNGDIFPVGTSKLMPFPPLSPNGGRSFPSKNLSKGHGQWNHYYVRGINGEIRLWVNGEEVSGGNNASPSSGHFCLEAEGAPVEFKNIRVRELP